MAYNVKLKRLTKQKVVIFTVYLFLCNIILAQSTDTTKLSDQNIEIYNKLIPVATSPNLQLIIFDEQIFLSTNAPSLELYQSNFTSGKNPLFKDLFFVQSKTGNTLPNLGGYEHFNNSFIYSAGNKIILDSGFGLAKQNTILSSNQPNLQYTFHTSLEYSFNQWLSVYLYGQYLVPPTNKTNNSFDPLTFMNPLLFQTETGGGLRAKYKNIKADVGLKNIYDTQFNQSNPVKSMDTKVSIGF